MDNDIKVSICCITYNQEKYIRDAIESFLKQKTNFKYEILIRDDASTDNTAKIIREYEEKYPDIIHGIYEEINSFKTKGMIRSILNVYSKAIGKYIAICEGDDYWIDENKLQIQYDYMEEHKNCTLCFHDAIILNMEDNKFYKYNYVNNLFKKKDGIYNVGELDIYGFIPAASYMFPKKCVEKVPDWYYECIVGDRPLKLIVTSYGYAYCIDKVMSVYRVKTGISMMDQLNNINLESKEKSIEYYDKIKWIIEKFDEFTDYKYKDYLEISKLEIEVTKLNIQERYKEIIKNKAFRKFLPKKAIISYYLKEYCPKFYIFLKSVKNKFWKTKTGV